eukprot:FR740075.1.p1 GENE.FR740075.1~~FR740075.1.p1  ORF type:complete len:108 (+),score=13.36 FR740075.1:118-441(+)
MGLGIVAFPCNQFGNQEPGTNEQIKQFVQEKGAPLMLMDKADVNGPNTHPVYRFLKAKANPPVQEITWNFGTYFIVTATGEVESYPHVSPMQLDGVIKQHLSVANEL